MSYERPVVLVLAALLVGTMGGPALVGAQEDVVTLTVTVSTPSGDPIGDASLTARWPGGSRTRTTASNGKAFIDVPEGADVELALRHDDYVRNFPLLVEDASERDVSMTAYEKGSVAVTVEDGSGPVAEASVLLRKDSRDVVSQTTDDSGVVDSGTIETGTYTVVVSKSGYFTAVQSVDVSGETALTMSIERGTVTLEVNVTDDHFDPPRPVEGATVDVADSGSVRTQPTGIGRISVPVNAWTDVQVTKDGYETAEESIFVSEEDKHVEVTVKRSPSVSVDLLNERVVIGERASLTVVDEYGDPVADAAVLLDGEEVARTDSSGQAVIRVESEGEHEVVVRKGSLESNATVVGIEEGTEPTATTTEGTMEETEQPETTPELPGFGVGVAVVALALAVLLARAGRSRLR